MPTAITQSPTRGAVFDHVDKGQIAAVVDLEQGEVRALIGSDDLRRQRLAAVEDDLDLAGVLDHVIIGHDIAVRADDEARALRLGDVLLRHPAPPLAKAPEEIVQRIVGRKLGALFVVIVGGFDRLDLDRDDRALNPLDDVGEGGGAGSRSELLERRQGQSRARGGEPKQRRAERDGRDGAEQRRARVTGMTPKGEVSHGKPSPKQPSQSAARWPTTGNMGDRPLPANGGGMKLW